MDIAFEYFPLNIIKSYSLFSSDEHQLAVLHADGDGHCLLHAVSRALVGRELFWHPLMCALKRHFAHVLDKYKLLFKDFIEASLCLVIPDELFFALDFDKISLSGIYEKTKSIQNEL